MNKSILNAQMGYRLAKFTLAAGTFILLFTVGSDFFPAAPQWVSALVGLFFGAVGVVTLDGGFDYLEDVGRQNNGQDAPQMDRAQKRIYYVLGALGVTGSMFVSILAASILSGVVVEDRSDVAEQMQETKQNSDAAYLTFLDAAGANVKSAERAVADAKAAKAQAATDAVNTIGGDFARDWKAGNAWVRTAPETAGHRRKIQRAEAAAQKEVDAASAALLAARAAYNDALTNARHAQEAATGTVLQGQQIVLDTWISKLASSRNFFINIDLFAGVMSILFYFLLFKSRSIPNEITFMELLVRLIRLIGDAVVAALGVGVTAAERSLSGRMGIVAPGNQREVLPPIVAPIVAPVLPLAVAPFCPIEIGATSEQAKEEKCCPVPTKNTAEGATKASEKGATNRPVGKGSQRDKIRRKITQYKRRAVMGNLSEKGATTLLQLEREYSKIKTQKP